MNTSAQRFNLTITASKPEGDEQVEMTIELNSSCSLNFMSNAFVQLLKQEELVKTAMLMAVTHELMADAVGLNDTKDLSEVDEIINKVINKK